MINNSRKKMFSLLAVSLSLFSVACAGTENGSFSGAGGDYFSSGTRTNTSSSNNNSTVFDRMVSLERKNDALQKELRASNARLATVSNRIEGLEQSQREIAGEVNSLVLKTDDMYPLIQERLAKQDGEIAILKTNIAMGTPSKSTEKSENTKKKEVVLSSDELYSSGLAAFKKREYSVAIEKFNSMIKTYPKANLVDNAYFWLGESYYQSGDYKASALQYEKVIKGYPKSNKLPASYLKQGLAFIKLNNTKVAKIRLNDVIEKFPKSPEANRAKEELKKISRKK